MLCLCGHWIAVVNHLIFTTTEYADSVIIINKKLALQDPPTNGSIFWWNVYFIVYGMLSHASEMQIQEGQTRV